MRPGGGGGGDPLNRAPIAVTQRGEADVEAAMHAWSGSAFLERERKAHTGFEPVPPP
jgi:hypothetical protein